MDEGSVSTCFVLSPLEAAPQGDAIYAALKKEFGKDARPADEKSLDAGIEEKFGGDSEDEEGGSGIWAIELDDSFLFLAFMPMKVPGDEVESNAADCFLLPGGVDALEGYRSHLIAGVFNGPEDPVDRALLNSRLARVALKTFDGIAVYWGAGATITDKETFLSAMEDASREEPPSLLWVRLQIYPDESGALGFYSYGMSQFGLMDVEIPPSKAIPAEVFQRGFMIVGYLVGAGPVINDGDTIGIDENDRIKVTHSPSLRDPDETVYRLHLEEDKPRKGFLGRLFGR